jgi:glycine cleavage system T protein (aminomethyltransferase)
VTSRRSLLHDDHVALGARMTDFGGWEMPLSYEGTVGEHHACRAGAVVFDVSHLGTVRVEGPGAGDRLQEALTNDLAKIGPGRAQYTHLCAEDGSVTDDLIVWWVGEERFDVMPNASNTERVLAAVGGRDVTGERAVLAVQGPDARRRLNERWPAVAAVGRFRVQVIDLEGEAVTVAGTGYTGEDGVELAVPERAARGVWRTLVEDLGITPAGLGARDTLRLEAGLPLHGHELGPGITPLQAGLGWVVAFDKPAFRGRAALLAERERGPSRRLVGLATRGRRPPREGQAVRRGGEGLGSTTSGNFSPTLGHGIALALLVPGLAAGEEVVLAARGGDEAATVTATPFVAPTPPTWSPR